MKWRHLKKKTVGGGSRDEIFSEMRGRLIKVEFKEGVNDGSGCKDQKRRMKRRRV